jgi:hypothetical protein
MTTHTSHMSWRKSSYSINGSQCVELADVGDAVHVRDSKHPDAGHLTFAPAEVAALVAAARAGELDYLLD